MLNVTRTYYRYDELAPEARRRAYETWGEYWAPRADVCLGPSVEEDLDSLRAALASIDCKLADWEVSYSGWGSPTCRVEVESGLERDMEDFSYERKAPALGELPAAKPDGYWIGEGFAERWNARCRPMLDAMLSEMRDAYAACATDEELEEEADVRGRALYEAYLGLAQEQADECMSEIGADVESFWSEEGFERDDEANEWYYEEDGTYVGRV